nr:hypothetical protein [Staphylococcus epidermidis]
MEYLVDIDVDDEYGLNLEVNEGSLLELKVRMVEERKLKRKVEVE